MGRYKITQSFLCVGMANDYLRNKWRLWFKAIDVKGEGKIYREDKKEEG